MALNKGIVSIELNRIYKKNSNIQKFFFNAAQAEFRKVKQKELLEEFDKDEVTKEILAEETANKGLLPRGNLYSFIGFDKQETGQDTGENNPALVIRKELEQKTQLNKKPIFSFTNSSTIVGFEVEAPTKQELNAVALQKNPLKRWTKRSWLSLIESGIAGLSHYVFAGRGKKLPGSFSGPALQKENVDYGGDFFKTSYITKILSNFTKKLR